MTAPNLPSSSATPNPRSRYWRSLDELQFTPRFQEFLHREFPQAASEFPEGVSRRRWMQLMGASFTLAGVAGCRWEAEDFLPAAGRVPNYIPGEPQFFATSHDLGGFGRALMVTCYDGRPIKAEGNPQHPQSRGASDAFSQAIVLDLYDPDRISQPRELAGETMTPRTWQQAEDALRGVIAAAGNGDGIWILAAASSSPTRDRLERRLAEKLPGAKWVEYEPVSYQAAEQGARQAFGQRTRVHYDTAAADILVCLDADLLGSHPDHLNLVRGWASRRTPETGSMNRMYAVESQFTCTGAAADHRKALASSKMPQFLAELEQEVDRLIGGQESGSSDLFIKAVASDLVEHRGTGLVAAGSRQPAAVHARVLRLNERLGNLGKTVLTTEEPRPERAPYAEGIAQLATEMQAGSVETLIILGGNPAYDAPADVNFAGALKKVKQAFSLTDYENETSMLCRWHLPATHPFEEWGDCLSYDGTYSLRQPLIDPLHAGKSAIELLAILLADGPRRGEQLVRDTFRERFGGNDSDWRKALHDGFVAGSALEPTTASISGDAGDNAPGQPPAGFELVFLESEHVYDGRFGNNGWLQETPGSITKLTWDNAALMSVKDAQELGVTTEDLITVTVNGQTVELPVFVLPGQAVGSIGVALGYGRTVAGLVGGYEVGPNERRADVVGVNVYPLRTTKSMELATGVKVEKVGATYPLAIAQDHHSVDTIGLKEIAERVPSLVREGTLEEFQHHPDFAEHRVHAPELESLWTSPDFSQGHAWGMAIDLSKCVGCNACSVACQSENNVPIVGKEQVRAGREMHWLRIDRYFRGAPEGQEQEGERPSVVAVTQPVFCMHCEHAPCEEVCPVAATVHDREGLNVMIYNRCVGTRYCSNNCPYKVRRFNFFNWDKQPVNRKYRDANNALAAMVRHPEVTVRSRGVMEKCTYCIQRIQHAKIEAKNEQRPIPDGSFTTACAQACPADALVFGDLLDKSSRVYQLHTNPRSYGMLAELNTRPRTRYLARIRNPHPLLEEPYAIPAEGHASELHDLGGEHEVRAHADEKPGKENHAIEHGKEH